MSKTLSITDDYIIQTNGNIILNSSTVALPSIEKLGANLVGNIGSSTNYFNYVYAQTTTAVGADVAERYAVDGLVAVGTVVEIGGVNEVTVCKDELSENVFGVVSQKPGILLNNDAGSEEQFPSIALCGRTNVRVIGVVNKGDRLVSAGNGLARAATRNEVTPFNVIGRSLVNCALTNERLIEAVVLAVR